MNAALLVALLPISLLCSCAFTPRVVALRHTEPVTRSMSIPKLSGLKVHLEDVVDGRSPNESWEGVPLTALPAGYAYRSPSSAERKAWDDAVQTADKNAPRYALGVVRNTYGASTAGVNSVNSPVQWIQDGLRTELEAHGVTLVGKDASDVSVRVTLKSFFADLYMSVSTNIAAEVRIKEADKEPRTILIHARDSSVAWAGSSWEYYCVMRGAQQKLLAHILLLTAGGEAPPTAYDQRTASEADF